MTEEERCARCGHTTPHCGRCGKKDLFLGANIDGKNYCHTFSPQHPSCYELEGMSLEDQKKEERKLASFYIEPIIERKKVDPVLPRTSSPSVKKSGPPDSRSTIFTIQSDYFLDQKPTLLSDTVSITRAEYEEYRNLKIAAANLKRHTGLDLIINYLNYK